MERAILFDVRRRNRSANGEESGLATEIPETAAAQRREAPVRTAMAVPMANGPPFATLNHFAADLGIPSESESPRIGSLHEAAASSVLSFAG